MLQTRCIETIRVENQKIYNLKYHNDRLNYTRNQLWNFEDKWDLAQLITIPADLPAARYKLRIAYQQQIENIRWEPYTQRTVNSIQLVYDDQVAYAHKYDRRDHLTQLYALRENADEILIVKNGMVTDAYFYNVAFYDGTQWYTPDTPLLPGTQRAFLLDTGTIQSNPISVDMLPNFKVLRLFNALNPWETAPELSIHQIQM
jgi:4-amino-4-deoxychorismate lyase